MDLDLMDLLGKVVKRMYDLCGGPSGMGVFARGGGWVKGRRGLEVRVLCGGKVWGWEGQWGKWSKGGKSKGV